MKSARYLDTVPAARPLLADDILEFHAARLLLLFRICGTANRIDGLTKMAKLDFFVRYPDFFARACRTEGFQCDNLYRVIESSMIRFHYGPWDQRYYHILAYILRLLDFFQIIGVFSSLLYSLYIRYVRNQSD